MSTRVPMDGAPFPCRTCGVVKARTSEHFEPSVSGKFGRTVCKACRNIYRRNRDDKRTSRRDAERNLRAITLAVERVQGRACKRCTKTKPVSDYTGMRGKICWRCRNDQDNVNETARMRRKHLEKWGPQGYICPYQGDVAPGMRRCPKCKDVKPANREHFARRDTKSGGWKAGRCLACGEKARLAQIEAKVASCRNAKGERRCARCKEWKPETVKHFERRSDCDRRTRPYCRKCHSLWNQVYGFGGRNLRQRMPDWLTDEHMQAIVLVYKQARDFSAVTGCEYQVDHMQPINGKDRSGLHVPWNLHVLLKYDNLSKSNRPPEVWLKAKGVL